MMRLKLFDTLKLRKTSVYKNPRDIVVLKRLYGDFTYSKIPCIAIDKAGLIYHIADNPIASISAVYVNGEPRTHGYQAHTAYQDETGKSIAAIVFDNPQFDAQIAVNCKGGIKQTGELIENPADLIFEVLLHLQGYDTDSIDMQDIYTFRNICMNEDIKIAAVIDEIITIREFLDALATNIHARWLISDGKSIMRLRWQT